MMRKIAFFLTVILCLVLAVDPALAQEKKKGKGGGGKGGGGKRRGKGGAPAQPGVPEGGAAVAASDELATLATKAFEAFRSKQMDSVYDNFDDAVKAKVSVDQLNQGWDPIAAQFGQFKSMGPIRALKQGPIEVRILPCTFEKTNKDFWIFFTGAKKIVGIAPMEPNKDIPPKPTPNPNGEPGEDIPIVVGSGQWALPGSLTLPVGDGPFPAVVLVHDAGAQDRDETIGANKPFQELAKGLSAKGVAVLRYEKRTKQHALAIASSATPLTVKEETVDDALAAVKTLRLNDAIDGKRVYVLGHGLGGMLVPRIGQGDPEIAGFIVLAGNYRSPADMIVDQRSYLATLNGPASTDAVKEINELKAEVAKIKALRPGVKPTSLFILGSAPEYWLDLRGYNPAEAAKAITKPMMIVRGERDFQVTAEDFAKWQEALTGKSNVTFKTYADLNHLFIAGKGKGAPAEYDQPGRIPQPVIDELAAWVKKKK